MLKVTLPIRYDDEWSVVITDEKKKLKSNGKFCAGITCYKEQTIYIDMGLRENQLYRVLLHELTHVYLYTTQINIQETYTEEDMCELVALFGVEIITKANEIIQIIMKKCEELKDEKNGNV